MALSAIEGYPGMLKTCPDCGVNGHVVLGSDGMALGGATPPLRAALIKAIRSESYKSKFPLQRLEHNSRQPGSARTMPA